MEDTLTGVLIYLIKRKTPSLLSKGMYTQLDKKTPLIAFRGVVIEK